MQHTSEDKIKNIDSRRKMIRENIILEVVGCER